MATMNKNRKKIMAVLALTLMGNAQDLDDVTFSITVSATQVD